LDARQWSSDADEIADDAIEGSISGSGIGLLEAILESTEEDRLTVPQGLKPASLLRRSGTLRRASLAQGRLKTEVVPFPKPLPDVLPFPEAI